MKLLASQAEGTAKLGGKVDLRLPADWLALAVRFAAERLDVSHTSRSLAASVALPVSGSENSAVPKRIFEGFRHAFIHSFGRR